MPVPVYIVYGRFSSQEQRGNSSEERQLDLEHYRKRASELNLPFIDKPYFDDAKSGYHGNNLEAELGRIFADIRSGALPPDSVIGVESHSRLGRLVPMGALMQYIGILKKGIKLDIRGKTLRTWQSINGMAGMPILFEDLIDMFVAHKHSADLSDVERKTNRSKREKIRNGQREHTMYTGTGGLFVGKRCPAWLDPVEKPVTIDGRVYMYTFDEERAAIVRQIFSWAKQGLGSKAITTRLNQMKIEPLSNKRKSKLAVGWTAPMVIGLLHSRTAIGEWQPQIRVPREGIGNVHSIRKIPDGEPIPNYYPPVIDLARFDDIQDSIKARLTSDGSKKFAKGGRKGRGFANLVYGLGSCSHCGGSLILWTKDRKKGKFLRCSNHHYKIVFPNGHSLAGQVCRNYRMFRYDKFESMFLNLFFVRDLIGKLVTHNRSDNSSIEHRNAEVRREIEKKKRAHQLREFELDDIEDADERRSHREQMRRLLSEVVELERESSELASKIRQHEKMNSADYVEWVKAGIARLHCTHEIERENARSTLNAILAERMTVRLTPERIMQVVCSNDDGVQVHGLIPDDPATHGWQIDYTSRTPHIAAKIVAETRAQGRPVQGEIIPPPYPTPFTFEGPRVKPVRGRA